MKLADQLFVATRLVGALRSEWWSAGRIAAHQEAALLAQLRHAVTNVPFYARLGIRPGQIRSLADLQRLPIVRKQDIQREPDAFVAAGFKRAELFASLTSGSSGEPTTTLFDRESWLRAKYVFKLRRMLATPGALRPLRRVLVVSELAPEALAAAGQAAPPQLGGVLFALRYVSIHAPMTEHLETIAAFRPDTIYAFPSWLVELLSVAERHGRALPQVATVTTSSEVLTEQTRRRIERAFRGRVCDVYGSTEFKEVAWQCAHGRYHLNFESVFVEAPTDAGVAPLVISSLQNRAMPLLRFQIGDRASLGAGRCGCGRESPHLQAIQGREGDTIHLPSGRRLSPYLLTMAIEADPMILQYQIVQTAADALRVDLLQRSRAEPPGAQGGLGAALRRLIGEPMRIELRTVDGFARAPGGKRSVFVRAPGLQCEPLGAEGP